MRGKTKKKKIVGHFSIISNIIKKFYGNFEKIFVIFWNDFVDVFRINLLKTSRKFFKKLQRKFWIDPEKIIEKLWRDNRVSFKLLIMPRLRRKFENISLIFCCNCEALKKCGEHFIHIFYDFDGTFWWIFEKKCEKLSKIIWNNLGKI